MNTVSRIIFLSSLLLVSVVISYSQSVTKTRSGEVPKGWHTMDKEKDGQSGISLEKTYEFLQSKKLKSKQVIVAVIDSGVDTLHEDLKDVLWHNPGEIPGNNIDDDKNGYVDDVYGWNFLGNKKGENVVQDSYEGARVYHGLKSKYEGKTIDESTLSEDDKNEYRMWKKAKQAVVGNEEEGASIDLLMLQRVVKSSKKFDSVLRKAMNKEEYTGLELKAFEPTSQSERVAKSALLSLMEGNNMMEISNKEFLEGFEQFLKSEEMKAEGKEKAPTPYRANIVGDNENDINDRFYGNNNVMVSNEACEHGTHVSGIIAAARKNGVGMDGIADNVKIMMIRAVPDGDEHDKDIALAIRYAVDNGAKIINMSFGKSFSPNKKWVDDAVAYAAAKGVLLVHAAGNDNKNIDSSDNFPNAIKQGATQPFTNWITIGASSNGNPKGDGYTASFSNYGKQQVDLFAPGTKIYATFPGGNVYRSLDGTSMASPVVAGTSALLLSYFPYLTPEQLVYCLEKGAQSPGEKVRKPGTSTLVELSELCKTGGLLNAYESAKVAASLQPAIAPPVKKNKKQPSFKNKKE